MCLAAHCHSTNRQCWRHPQQHMAPRFLSACASWCEAEHQCTPNSLKSLVQLLLVIVEGRKSWRAEAEWFDGIQSNGDDATQSFKFNGCCVFFPHQHWLFVMCLDRFYHQNFPCTSFPHRMILSFCSCIACWSRQGAWWLPVFVMGQSCCWKSCWQLVRTMCGIAPVRLSSNDPLKPWKTTF